MKNLRSILWFLIFGSSMTIEAYRILGIYPFCSRSHQMMYDTLSRGLAKRGHHVDIVTCFPPKQQLENLTVIMNVEDSQHRLVNNWSFDMAVHVGTDTLRVIAGMYGNELCHLLAREEIQRIVKNPTKDRTYDLIIVEAFGANCFIGLGAILKVPVIFASTTVEMPWIDRSIGNPPNLAFYPSFFAGFKHPMTFWERLSNLVRDLKIRYRFDSITGEVQTELMRKYLSPDIPHVRELEKRITMILVNSFHTLTGVRPTTTGLIEVGGLHVEDDYPEPPEELKVWLDESKDGVVYFTFGSMVNIETMPESVIKGLYSAFEKIAPTRVLMKVADRNKLPPGQPKNLITSSWIPQIPVLAHNNTRVFITHGGLMSTQEALYYGVPLIGIPLFGDQAANLNYYVDKKMAVLLDFNNINERTMTAAFNKVLKDPSYKKSAKIQSARFRDRPMSAMETAIFWVEYVIRHGPEILRSPVADLTWWQNELLDVYAFFLISFIIALSAAIFIIKFIVNIILRVISSRNTPVDSSHQKKRN